MHGEEKKKMNNKISVGDADALVALAYKDDANHMKAKKISEWFIVNNYEIIYPNTAILEAITALKRSLGLIEEAHLINKQYIKGAFLVEYVNDQIQHRASQRLEKTISKKNTIFDAVVAETAIELGAEYIFSFDGWYVKEGFNLVPIDD